MYCKALSEEERREMNQQLEKVMHKRNKLMALFDSFVESTEPIVEVVYEGEYKSVQVAQSSLHKSAKRHGSGVKVVRRGEKIYLINEKLVKGKGV